MNEKEYSVLILDDEESVRMSLGNFFEDQEWDVLTATTAEEAIELLKKNHRDGAIVDMRLPGMDGNEFLRKISKSHPSIACVIFTGSPEYVPPKDVLSLPQLSSKVFAKPVVDLLILKEELINQISKCREESNDYK